MAEKVNIANAIAQNPSNIKSEFFVSEPINWCIENINTTHPTSQMILA